jgi:hypothetical protein
MIFVADSIILGAVPVSIGVLVFGGGTPEVRPPL